MSRDVARALSAARRAASAATAQRTSDDAARRALLPRDDYFDAALRAPPASPCQYLLRRRRSHDHAQSVLAPRLHARAATRALCYFCAHAHEQMLFYAPLTTLFFCASDARMPRRLLLR